MVVTAGGAIEGAVTTVVGCAALGGNLFACQRLARRHANRVPLLRFDALPIKGALVLTHLGAYFSIFVVDAVLAVALIVFVAGIAKLPLSYAQTLETRFGIDALGITLGLFRVIPRIFHGLVSSIGRGITARVVDRPVIVVGDRINRPRVTGRGIFDAVSRWISLVFAAGSRGQNDEREQTNEKKGKARERFHGVQSRTDSDEMDRSILDHGSTA